MVAPRDELFTEGADDRVVVSRDETAAGRCEALLVCPVEDWTVPLDVTGWDDRRVASPEATLAAEELPLWLTEEVAERCETPLS